MVLHKALCSRKATAIRRTYAHILSTVQRAIEAQERIIQTTTELKTTLMHKLLF